jgi:hypothetical protein
LSVTFLDGWNHQPLLIGRLPNVNRLSLGASLDVVSVIGGSRTWALARKPWVRLRIVNPKGVVLPRNALAESFTENEVNLVRYFNHPVDDLEFGQTNPYGTLNSKPQFVQFMKSFQFVDLHPQ